jgi:putative redox protein
VKAIAHRTDTKGLAHDVELRDHRLLADEPEEHGGDDKGPTPQELLAASLAACTAITIEMYARRKEWDIGDVEVECNYAQAQKGEPTLFKLALRLPSGLTPEQVERLEVIAAKCPIHRTLSGETLFEQEVELVEPATG